MRNNQDIAWLGTNERVARVDYHKIYLGQYLVKYICVSVISINVMLMARSIKAHRENKFRTLKDATISVSAEEGFVWDRPPCGSLLKEAEGRPYYGIQHLNMSRQLT
jgi:hypothetical protein